MKHEIVAPSCKGHNFHHLKIKVVRYVHMSCYLIYSLHYTFFISNQVA